MLYNLVMMFCFMQFIMVVAVAAVIVLSINIVSSFVRMFNKVNHNNINNNVYYMKNRGVRGIVRILGGRAFSAKPVAMSTRRNRKLLTAVARKEAWLVKHSTWLVQKNKVHTRTNRVRKQEKISATRIAQVVHARRKHVVTSRVYTNAMPKVAMYTSTLHVDMVRQAACTLASVLLHTEDKTLKGKATLNETAQRAAMAAIWAGNTEARAVFSALRTEGMQIRTRRTQIWNVLNSNE